MYYIEAKEKLNQARTKRRIVREGIERLPASVRVAPCFLVLPCYMLIARQRWFIARNIFYARMRCVKISIFLHFLLAPCFLSVFLRRFFVKIIILSRFVFAVFLV